MKKILLFFTAIVTAITFTNSGCRKQNSSSGDKGCGCSTDSVKYRLQNISGTLSYYQYKSRWVLSYHPFPGSVSNYFPCNTTLDSLRSILQNADHSQVFYVDFSGKVKGACAGEDFGVISGLTTFDYIVLDSIKRN